MTTGTAELDQKIDKVDKAEVKEQKTFDEELKGGEDVKDQEKYDVSKSLKEELSDNEAPEA